MNAANEVEILLVQDDPRDAELARRAPNLAGPNS
jgi:hypothetical protein